MNPQDPVLVLLREHVAAMLLGTVFLFVGLVACCIAAARRRGESRLLVWFGLFIGLYGLRMLADADSVLHLSPKMDWPARVVICVYYLLVIPALLFWIELTLGLLRRLLQVLTAAATTIAALGLGWYIISGQPYTFLRYNSLLAICVMVVIGVLVAVPRVSRKYLVVQSFALRVVMPAIALITLYVNVMWFFGVPPAPYIEPIAFAGWISAIGFEAARHTFDNERRLFTIEGELETARQIQSSILPDRVPTVAGLRIAASYNPMSAVAGDFYQFLQIDERHIGVLVADVSGQECPRR
jgi:sigma-B regulation protein RsbU (phosphoserine phosphatase)